MNLLSFFVLLFCFQFLHSQKLNLNALSDKIYVYNNNLQYKKSQDTLITLLQNENLSPEDKGEINILLSFTYKRLEDYTSVNYYLTEAKKIAIENRLKRLSNIIDAQFAFSYFDTQSYKKSGTIMKKIAAKGYEDLPADERSKVLMQQGYISFLDKDFYNAEKYYQQSSIIMEENNNCDLPIIYGKEIELYFAENNPAKAFECYHKGIQKARQCKILKYEMYLSQVFINIYKEREDAKNTLKFTRKYDSLNAVYRREENIQALHLNREAQALRNGEKIEKSKIQITLFYIITVILLILFLFLIGRHSLNLKNKNKQHEKEIDRMKQTLIEYENERAKGINQKSKLNSKQLLMLEMIRDGKSNKEIANHFSIAESTVKYHIKKLYEILNVKSRKHLKA
ncbi:helix-turn-helix transcriptional regulator [uncultured Chryseobacterium sp.]|uniref:helix-turn-helix transcriptional regulator n=1 Tax=uncultured Chryseobacterium sp. TaxID=259322 RepID=UPI0025EB74C6|nr:helix-turn-helix transcriptional regulator [uncultured Chryseobacterium sp.]